MFILIAIAVFVVVALGVFVVASLLDERSSKARLLRERLSTVQKSAGTRSRRKLALLRDEVLSKIPALDNLLRRSGSVSNLQTLLEQARCKEPRRQRRASGLAQRRCVWACWFCFSAIPAICLAGRAASGSSCPTRTPITRRNKRFQKFEELFPEAIDTLARAVRAGHAFTTALELIASEIADPVASEFRKLFEEQKFGMPVRDALINLTERVPLVDVKFFVTAVMLQRETGGNLAEILDNLSYVIRERFKIMRQVRVHTAQGRMTMMLLMGLPPIIMVTMQIMNPSFIRPLFDDPIGHILMVVGITLQTVGYFVIRKIIQIQV